MGLLSTWSHPINCTFLQFIKLIFFTFLQSRQYQNVTLDVALEMAAQPLFRIWWLIGQSQQKRSERVHKWYMCCLAKCITGNADNYKNTDFIERHASD